LAPKEHACAGSASNEGAASHPQRRQRLGGPATCVRKGGGVCAWGCMPAKAETPRSAKGAPRVECALSVRNASARPNRPCWWRLVARG